MNLRNTPVFPQYTPSGMNIFIKLIILFVFVFALLMFNIPGLNPTDFIKFKIYLFFGIVLFEVCVSISEKIYHKKIIDIVPILKQAVQIGLVSIVAYSIYTDLSLQSSPLVAGANTIQTQNLAISIMICLFVWVIYFTDSILTNISPQINSRINTIRNTL